MTQVYALLTNGECVNGVITDLICETNPHKKHSIGNWQVRLVYGFADHNQKVHYSKQIVYTVSENIAIGSIGSVYYMKADPKQNIWVGNNWKEFV